ncbi:MAG: acylphosphatase [Clostridia bacterium]|nr:acylphosphatase [Clostridia bacterium]NCC76054.1 acylphosphatase [Clostridia bacterium]
MPVQRLKIICSGLVQAVGFRYFVKTTAHALGLAGFVENLDTGDVLIEAQGTPEQLQALLVRIEKGNGYSRIDHLVRYPLPVDPHAHNFEIRYDF